MELDWSALRGGGSRRKVSLPTYPFERTEHRVLSPAARASASGASAPALGDPHHHIEQIQMSAGTDMIHAPERLSGIADGVAEVFARLLGTEPARLERDATFLSQGADSLLLMQATRIVESAFGVRVPFRQLLEEHSTIQDLAAYLDTVLPADFPLPGDPPAASAAEVSAAPAQPALASPAVAAAPVAMAQVPALFAAPAADTTPE